MIASLVANRRTEGSIGTSSVESNDSGATVWEYDGTKSTEDHDTGHVSATRKAPFWSIGARRRSAQGNGSKSSSSSSGSTRIWKSKKGKKKKPKSRELNWLRDTLSLNSSAHSSRLQQSVASSQDDSQDESEDCKKPAASSFNAGKKGSGGMVGSSNGFIHVKIGCPQPTQAASSFLGPPGINSSNAGNEVDDITDKVYNLADLQGEYTRKVALSDNVSQDQKEQRLPERPSTATGSRPLSLATTAGPHPRVSQPGAHRVPLALPNDPSQAAGDRRVETRPSVPPGSPAQDLDGPRRPLPRRDEREAQVLEQQDVPRPIPRRPRSPPRHDPTGHRGAPVDGHDHRFRYDDDAYDYYGHEPKDSKDRPPHHSDLKQGLPHPSYMKQRAPHSSDMKERLPHPSYVKEQRLPHPSYMRAPHPSDLKERLPHPSYVKKQRPPPPRYDYGDDRYRDHHHSAQPYDRPPYHDDDMYHRRCSDPGNKDGVGRSYPPDHHRRHHSQDNYYDDPHHRHRRHHDDYPPGYHHEGDRGRYSSSRGSGSFEDPAYDSRHSGREHPQHDDYHRDGSRGRYQEDNYRGTPHDGRYQQDWKGPVDQQRPKEDHRRTPLAKDPLMVEISPGCVVPLRRTEETMVAVAMDFYRSTTCIGCSQDMFCIVDVCYVVCPNCRTVGPLEGHTYFEGREITSEGLGLGFTTETLFKMQQDILQRRSHHAQAPAPTPRRSSAEEKTSRDNAGRVYSDRHTAANFGM